MDRRRVARPQRILVVDDSADMRDLWNLWLTAHGFSVLEAQNGAEALQQVDERPPDLVLLDVMMPVMDGLETLKRLRAQTQRHLRCRSSCSPLKTRPARGGRVSSGRTCTCGSRSRLTI